MENKKNKPINIIHKISDKTIAIVMALGLFISLIPIVVLAFYNYPCADDFSASDTAHWAWQETGSLWEVIKAAWENVVYNYENWSGVYTSVFWTSMQPGLFGEEFYGINNALITLNIDVEVNAKIILPIVSDDIHIDASIPIAMKVIQGKIPEYYLNGFSTKSNIVTSD